MSSKDTFTAEVPERIEEAPEYKEWEENIDGDLLIRVTAAKATIKGQKVLQMQRHLGTGFMRKSGRVALDFTSQL